MQILKACENKYDRWCLVIPWRELATDCCIVLSGTIYMNAFLFMITTLITEQLIYTNQMKPFGMY